MNDYAPSKEQQVSVAEQQIEQFKSERFGHEMILARLDAVPADQRDASWNDEVQRAKDAMATIEAAIDSARGVITNVNADQPLPVPDVVPQDEPASS